MITSIVRYKPARRLAAAEVETMMKGAASNLFKGIPGLHEKQFCFDVEAGTGLSVYLWESREIAERFFNDAFLENFRTNFGCTPEIEYWPTIVVVDNRSAQVLPGASTS